LPLRKPRERISSRIFRAGAHVLDLLFQAHLAGDLGPQAADALQHVLDHGLVLGPWRNGLHGLQGVLAALVHLGVGAGASSISV
jgi:hypothetical protein